MEKDHLKNQGIDEKIILKWMFQKWDGEKWTELLRLRTGTGGGTCECSNELRAP